MDKNFHHKHVYIYIYIYIYIYMPNYMCNYFAGDEVLNTSDSEKSFTPLPVFCICDQRTLYSHLPV